MVNPGRMCQGIDTKKRKRDLGRAPLLEEGGEGGAGGKKSSRNLSRVHRVFGELWFLGAAWVLKRGGQGDGGKGCWSWLGIGPASFQGERKEQTREVGSTRGEKRK